ncbi:MAG: adaptor protein MecA [Bombilactobacillus mellifer]|uniref:adaptor protein MecA n=1 Tax=Bombilactobacillus mellifer TaxID=1218492 RepID=UPI0023F2647F|nr:adaptor protein MecA [Bombilactobacillus mellifer]MCT6826868.1 adaptor protein MecA [Bombilactobacillus mellifer]MCT6843845.1 adaptor protein MecA [Bombilactobacillus mellifer]MCT6894742.1 adaptor protein MecA [Bombilactobacillus mellifer]
MEVEHVNENMIRVFLANHDLEERGVDVLDLLGNRKQIESFFYSILEEVDTDHKFSKDQAVTFQVMPNTKGLELLITRIPSEMDDKTTDFNLLDEDSAKTEVEAKATEDTTDSATSSTAKQQVILVSFDQFEDFVDLSRNLVLEAGQSDLYQYQGRFYLKLTLFVDELRNLNVDDIQAIAAEYGNLETQAPETIAEFGQEVMSQTALELARYYFR